MKAVFLDGLIVLAGVMALVMLSFIPSVPWIYLPAVVVVLWLTVKALKVLNPMAPDSPAPPPERRGVSSSETGG